MTTQCKRPFDRHFKTIQEESVNLSQRVRKGFNNLRLAKQAAYRMATSYLAAAKEDHNRLIDLIKSTHGGERDPVDAWLYDNFAPLRALGEDHNDLFSAIKNSMTEKQYMAGCPRLFVAGKKLDEREAKRLAAAVPVPPDPKPENTVEEQNGEWRLQNRALKEQLRATEEVSRDQKKEIESLLKRCLTAESRLRAIEKAMKPKAEKKTA